MSESSLDLRLIPEFGGSPVESVTEWLEKLELICRLRNVTDLQTVIPLKLTGGAFAVYQHLSDEKKKDVGEVKTREKKTLKKCQIFANRLRSLQNLKNVTNFHKFDKFMKHIQHVV